MAPNPSRLMLRAALGIVPGVARRGADLPDQVRTASDLRIDVARLARYSELTGLRLTGTVPATFPYVLSFPLIMDVLTAPDFPFSAIGVVHTRNVVTVTRPIDVTEPLDLRVHATDLREHRRGLQVDVVTECRVGRELVATNTATFLHQQKTSVSEDSEPPRPNLTGPQRPNLTGPQRPRAFVRATKSTVAQYAAVSGDRNPIHISTLGAKVFGFPSVITHGMWTAARALSVTEGKLPEAFTYDVTFVKPIVVPARVALFGDQHDEGWDLAIRTPTRFGREDIAHLSATIR